MSKEKVNYAPLLPLQPPERLWQLAKMKKALNVNALVYRVGWVYDPYEERKKQMAKIHCSACDETFYYPLCKKTSCSGYTHFGFDHPSGEEIYSGTTCLCPECGAQVKALHVSAFGKGEYYMLHSTWPITFAKVENHLALIAWRVFKSVDKEGKVSVTSMPYEAYISEGKKTVRYVGYYKYFSTTRWTGQWERRSKCIDEYGSIGSAAFLAPTAAQLRGTEMENCKIGRYMQKGTRPVAYMQVYLKHPNVENLIMQGCEGLIDELIEKSPVYSFYYYRAGVKKDLQYINWKKKRPSEMLGMTGQEFSYFRKNCNSLAGLEMFALLRKYDECAAIQRVPGLLKWKAAHIERILACGVAPEKTFRYLERQGKKYPKDRIDAIALTDYWRMMGEQLREDLSDPDLRWPQRLLTAHDQASERIATLAEKGRAKDFKKRYDQLKKYTFEQGGLLIRPAQYEREFRKEGKELHHCVAGYATQHMNGGTAIFFIRKADAPDTPYYTLEYNEKNGNVCQNRGLRNCARTEEVQAFEDAWLKWIAGGMKQTMKKESKKNGKSNDRAKKRGTAVAVA